MIIGWNFSSILRTLEKLEKFGTILKCRRKQSTDQKNPISSKLAKQFVSAKNLSELRNWGPPPQKNMPELREGKYRPQQKFAREGIQTRVLVVTEHTCPSSLTTTPKGNAGPVTSNVHPISDRGRVVNDTKHSHLRRIGLRRILEKP